VLAKTKQLRAELSDDAFNIKETGRFCTERMRDATDDLVAAYLTVGKALDELHSKLTKTTPRGDNEHIGWKKAFKQLREDGRPVFPFGQKQAQRYIKASKFLRDTPVSPKILKCLPSSLRALIAIIDFKFSRAQIEKAVEQKTITTFTETSHIRKLAKQLGLLQPEDKTVTKTKPKRDRIARAFELLAKLGVTLDDLIEETGGRK
jgi:hypothetical protein